MVEKNFDKAFEEVKKIVAKFKQGEKHYLSQSYQEAEVRQDFLDGFFTALGWDIGHKTQHDPYAQEVKVEKGVRVSGAQKRADYSFAIAPNFRDPKFFAEAKKPSKDLKNAQDYFQSIRYGWHKGHPLSILTDFEEFHVLDCRYTPDINNSLDKCYKRFHYTDYLDKEKFAEIYFLFSRESVANGSIEKVAEGLPKRKGKATSKTLFPLEHHQTIDEAFLDVIDSIREKLAKAFKKQDENLTSEELTEATQRTVDRLVFIRFLEDKLIEQEHYVSEFGDTGSAWSDFISTCRKLDAKYNGVVFKKHFIDEQHFEGPEANEFHSICQDICHLNSRFLYNEIPIHILGSIYERFLGKVVHATAKRVTVEEKPEVQKAGGVYYTPKYIVDYIVKNTVGKLIEGKTPEQIAKLRFADIACGSGSFLIGVFDCLLDYHNKYYQKNPDKAKKDKCIEKDDLWVLSIKQKQKILLNNIYGVDIDQQATEVTQLSLALKMLEDETTATANDMQVLFHEKILPDMGKNIICGNAIIGTDILTFNGFFSGEEERKLNPMDFQDVFKDIMRDGGFDAIVGNPPWSSKMPNTYVKYISQKYNLNGKNVNLFAPFLVKSYRQLISNGGIVGILIPKVFIKNTSYTIIRKDIIDNYSLDELTDFGKFPEVASDCVVPFISKEKGGDTTTKVFDKIKLIKTNSYKQALIKKNSIYAFSSELNLKLNNLLDKIFTSSIKLDEICSIKRGIELGQKALLVKCENCGSWNEAGEKYYNTASQKICKSCKSNIRLGKNITISSKEKNNTYDLKCVSGKEINRYEIISNYFIKSKLKGVDYKNDIFKGDRIFVKRISTKPEAVFVKNNDVCFAFNTVYSLYDLKAEVKFVLGVLNSNLIRFYYEKSFNIGMELTSQITTEYLRLLPIPKINFKNKTEKGQHDKIVSLVEKLIEARKEIKTAKTEKDKTYSERKYSSIDSAIDSEVYKLYDLSDGEIKIIDSK